MDTETTCSHSQELQELNTLGSQVNGLDEAVVKISN